jgi:hypothetical protein
VPADASAANTHTQLVMLWDRQQTEEKTNLYGRLLDNFNLHCEVDGYCFGDLFADNGWICTVEHTDVSKPFPVWDNIYPGAPSLSSGAVVSGPACTAGMGSSAQASITAAFKAIYGTGGVFQTAKHQPRHTVNNFVVTEQHATTMTTQHYQIIERAFNVGGHFITYDGSGYTVQLKWAKTGPDYAGVWKITQMVETHNGNGHLGLPGPTNPGMAAAHEAFVNGMRHVGGLDLLGRRKLSEWKPPKRELQSTPKYGNFDPTTTRIPAPTTDAQAAQMAWDREDILEHISMYAWLADETRVNSLQGFAWGDMWANDGTFCIYSAGDSWDMPSFDNYVAGEHFLERPFVGGPCAADAPAGCASTCSPGMGAYAQNNMQHMIAGTFGTGGAAQTSHQQTRHTLTNKIFLDQTLTTATTQVTNTLERFMSGVAYDSSLFVYQHKFVKQSGLWKYSNINAFSQANGHLNTGLPSASAWQAYIGGHNNYPGSVGVTERGRMLQGGNGLSVTTGTIAADVVAPNIQVSQQGLPPTLPAAPAHSCFPLICVLLSAQTTRHLTPAEDSSTRRSLASQSAPSARWHRMMWPRPPP